MKNDQGSDDGAEPNGLRQSSSSGETSGGGQSGADNRGASQSQSSSKQTENTNRGYGAVQAGPPPNNSNSKDRGKASKSGFDEDLDI